MVAIIIALSWLSIMFMVGALVLRWRQVAAVVEAKRLLAALLSNDSGFASLLQRGVQGFEIQDYGAADRYILAAMARLSPMHRREFEYALRAGNKRRIVREIAVVSRCMRSHAVGTTDDRRPIRILGDQNAVLLDDHWLLRSAQ